MGRKASIYRQIFQPHKHYTARVHLIFSGILHTTAEPKYILFENFTQTIITFFFTRKRIVTCVYDRTFDYILDGKNGKSILACVTSTKNGTHKKSFTVFNFGKIPRKIMLHTCINVYLNVCIRSRFVS